ncbi:MAG: helix-turn-helix domain-containing protein [Desulfomonile tiedjei]|uniref:Helix-turn-helix domain-containing protein n=1 Tax=Desulfomonile tiedjei TaxID=2358 RepID=A0A9D6Z0T1_9BACT|nr:helix-turn-helix domain-containing protein [Desulfomonile tiedjei]
MKPDKTDPSLQVAENGSEQEKPRTVLDSNIADSIDMLVEYLVDNQINGIHPLIMGEVEKRLIIKVLERSRGNKLQAARLLGMSRNTFSRKIQKLVVSSSLGDEESEM